MHEKMFSYLNIYKMKWFDLHAFLLNSFLFLEILDPILRRDLFLLYSHPGCIMAFHFEVQGLFPLILVSSKP